MISFRPARWSWTTLALSVLPFALLLALPGCGEREERAPTVTLRGKVLACDGSAPRAARVARRAANRRGAPVLAVAEMGPDGSFTIEVPAGEPCTLQVSAVDHQETAVPVYLAAGDPPATVTVRLAGNPFVEHPERVRLIGSWLDFDWRNAVEMTRREDGTWTWEGPVEAGRDGTVGYQLLDIVPGHSVNGTDAIGWEYDGGGDWISRVRVEGGKVRIVFDPRKLPPRVEGDLPAAEWDEAHAWLGELEDLYRESDRARNRLWNRMRALGEAGRKITRAALTEPRAALAAHRRHLAEVAAGDGPAPLRAWVAASLLDSLSDGSTAFEDPERLEKELAEAWRTARPLLPPESPFWTGVSWRALDRLARLAGDPLPTAMLEEMARRNPVEDVRGQAMLALLQGAVDRKDEQAARRWWNELSRWFGDRRDYRVALRELNPDRRIAVGKPVPSFRVKTLDGRELTDRDLRGKVVLLDFWATWCGPCVGEMPHLHEAYRKYHDRGFEIVSFSLDTSPAAVAKFRAGEWKMPWTHVFLPGGFDSDLAQAFEVRGIPEPVLVGRDGTIVAVEPQTRGDGLLRAVEKALGEDGAGRGPGQPRGSQSGRPRARKIVSAGQKPVNADWTRLRPTKTSSR